MRWKEGCASQKAGGSRVCEEEPLRDKVTPQAVRPVNGGLVRDANDVHTTHGDQTNTDLEFQAGGYLCSEKLQPTGT